MVCYSESLEGVPLDQLKNATIIENNDEARACFDEHIGGVVPYEFLTEAEAAERRIIDDAVQITVGIHAGKTAGQVRIESEAAASALLEQQENSQQN